MIEPKEDQDETLRNHLREGLLRLDDGFHYFPENRRAISSHEIRIIGELLEEKNKEWDKQVKKDLAKRSVDMTIHEKAFARVMKKMEGNVVQFHAKHGVTSFHPKNQTQVLSMARIMFTARYEEGWYSDDEGCPFPADRIYEDYLSRHALVYLYARSVREYEGIEVFKPEPL